MTQLMTDGSLTPALPIPKISVGGLNVHYRQQGSGSVMVLIHGLTGSLADWQLGVVPLLTDRFALLTYDLRGHGLTDMPPTGYTSAHMATDLRGLLEALGIQRAHVVGHSYGGTVALHFAALHPEHVIALTIADSRVRTLQPRQKLKDWTYWPKWKEQLGKRGVALDDDNELDLSILEVLFSQPSSQAELPAAGGRREERWKKLLSSTTASADFRDPAGLTADVIGEIRVPTQAVYGQWSFCLQSLHGLTECLPALRSTILPDVGHFFPVRRPELFAQHLIEFHSTMTPEQRGGSSPGEPKTP